MGKTYQDEHRAIRDECIPKTRLLRDKFLIAQKSQDPMNAEMSFQSMKSLLKELWTYESYRDQPFRDLLALIEAALVPLANFSVISERQGAAIGLALRDLAKWPLDDSEVVEHIARFEDNGIDMSAPLTGKGREGYKITIERIE